MQGCCNQLKHRPQKNYTSTSIHKDFRNGDHILIIDITYLELVQIRAFGGFVGVAHVIGIIHTNESQRVGSSVSHLVLDAS
jgi:hypothetical protein